MRFSLDRLQQAALLITAAAYSAGYATLGLVLILILVIVESVVMKSFPWHRSRLDALLGAFMGGMLLSGWLSPHRPIAVASAGLAAMTVYLSFGTLLRIVRRAPRFLDRFLGAWVIGGTVTALWGIGVYVSMRDPAFTPSLGRNAVGTTLLVALALTLGLFATRAGRMRWLLAAAVAVQTVGLAVTFTRGAWFGAIGALVVLLVLEGRRAGQGVALVLVVGVLAAALAGPERVTFVRKIVAGSRIEENRGRIAIARSAVNIFLDHPIAGTGVNTFSLEYPKYQFQDDVSPTQPSAHNIFLNMAAETGILGLIAFVGIILSALLLGLRQHAGAADARRAVIAAAVLSAFVGLVIHQQFDGTAISVHLGLGMWFLIALLADGRPRA